MFVCLFAFAGHHQDLSSLTRDQTPAPCSGSTEFKLVHTQILNGGNRMRTLGINHYVPAAAAAAKSLQSCPTLCDPIDGSPPGSSVP